MRLVEPPQSSWEYVGPALREIGHGYGLSPSPSSELVMLLVSRGVFHRFVYLSMANTLTTARRIGVPAIRGFDRFC